jgi:hypothetical protein
MAAVRKTKFAAVVDADKAECFRLSDRGCDSITAQAVFNKLSGGNLELSFE